MTASSAKKKKKFVTEKTAPIDAATAGAPLYIPTIDLTLAGASNPTEFFSLLIKRNTGVQSIDRLLL